MLALAPYPLSWHSGSSISQNNLSPVSTTEFPCHDDF